MITFNANNGVAGDTTTLFSAVVAGITFANPNPKSALGLSLKLVSGSTVTGRLEGSNDNLAWDTVQTADTTTTVVGGAKNAVVIYAPYAYLRYNVTGITGTALALLSYDNH